MTSKLTTSTVNKSMFWENLNLKQINSKPAISYTKLALDIVVHGINGKKS